MKQLLTIRSRHACIRKVYTLQQPPIVAKFYEANCLVDMAYVKEDDMTVAQYVAKTAKELGGNITIASFSRFEKGEGIEKKEEDFAAEIEKLASGK